MAHHHRSAVGLDTGHDRSGNMAVSLCWQQISVLGLAQSPRNLSHWCGIQTGQTPHHVPTDLRMLAGGDAEILISEAERKNF